MTPRRCSRARPRPRPAGRRPPHRHHGPAHLPAAERGSIGLWLLGLCVMLLFLGGIGLDLWRGFAERRGLAAAADAAAVAAAQALDTEHFRAEGEVMLDPELAEALAQASLASQPEAASLTGAAVDARPERVTVTVNGEVPLTLLAVLAGDQDTLEVSVRSTAVPDGPEP